MPYLDLVRGFLFGMTDRNKLKEPAGISQNGTSVVRCRESDRGKAAPWIIMQHNATATEREAGCLKRD